MKHYRPTYTTSMEIILFHEILKYTEIYFYKMPKRMILVNKKRMFMFIVVKVMPH